MSMARGSNAALFSVLLLLTSCTDATAPNVTDETDQSRRDLNILRVAVSDPPPARCGSGWLRVEVVPCEGGALLSQGPTDGLFTTSFWATRGTESVVRISYEQLGVTAAGSADYLEFRVPAGGLAVRPDGTPFSTGDAIEITLTVDRNQFLVEFEPSGLVFSSAAPAQLSLWYSGASDDLDADGDVDGDDLAASEQLGIWYQEGDGSLWDPIAAVHFPTDERFAASLFHFSNYAVGW